MDTNVGHIKGIYKPREAESADTRYDLLHHEKDNPEHRTFQDRSSSDDFHLTDTDQATVSTEALVVYLERYMFRTFGVTEKDADRKGSKKAASQQKIEDLRVKAAQASKAYSRAARVSRQVSKKAVKSSQAAADFPSDSDDEFGYIAGLIRDLRVLAKHGVKGLLIERGKSFIDSIAVAIEEAKQDIS